MIEFKMKDIVKLHKKKDFLKTFSHEEKIKITGKNGKEKKKETKIINKISKLNQEIENLIDELFGNK